MEIVVRALLCILLVACRANSAHGPADAKPSAISDGAMPADSTMRDGATPADSTMLDGATDSTPLVDAPVMIDATAVLVDAHVTIDGAVLVDASSPTPNTVSCYAVAAPATTCTLPTHCCFSNFDSSHQGDCTAATCAWGTISCDGPEDCASGERCCAHAIIDPDQGLTGYTLACQATACGAAPANQEMCHAGTCSSGTCVSVVGHDTDLPRTLSICQ